MPPPHRVCGIRVCVMCVVSESVCDMCGVLDCVLYGVCGQCALSECAVSVVCVCSV